MVGKTSYVLVPFLGSLSAGFLAVYLTKQEKDKSIDASFKKVSHEVDKVRSEALRVSQQPNQFISLPNQIITMHEDIFQHLRERTEKNKCIFSFSMNGFDDTKKGIKNIYLFSEIFNSKAPKDGGEKSPAWKLREEIRVTNWKKHGRKYIDNACFKFNEVLLVRKPSQMWKGAFYWDIYGVNKSGRAAADTWFWQ